MNTQIVFLNRRQKKKKTKKQESYVHFISNTSVLVMTSVMKRSEPGIHKVWISSFKNVIQRKLLSKPIT